MFLRRPVCADSHDVSAIQTAPRRASRARWSAHGVVLALVLATAVGVQLQGSAPVAAAAGAPVPEKIPQSEPAMPVSAPALVAEPTASVPMLTAQPTLPAATPTPKLVAVPTPKAPPFIPAVERWRPLSREASTGAVRLTGIRLDEDLLLALVAVESGGEPQARSAAGALGLTQIEPATFDDLRARYGPALSAGSIDDPGVNLLAGALYLVDCARLLNADLTNARDLPDVLHAYNLGPGAMIEALRQGDPLPAETIDHAARVLSAYAAARPRRS